MLLLDRLPLQIRRRRWACRGRKGTTDPESALRARARGKNNAALPLECRKMDLHPVITGFLLAIIFAAFLIVGFVS